MRDLNDLFYFASVVEHRGFAAAARALGLQKSKLSRRVAALEESLGVRLLNRSSRSFSVTEVGREFHDHCVAMLVEAEAAEQVALSLTAAPRGVVRLSCPIALLDFQFGRLFAAFMASYPQIDLQLEATNRRVDVIAENFDLAIRVRFPPLEPSELVMRQLDTSSQCLVASPALVPRRLHSPADLAGLPSLDLGPPRRDHHWTLRVLGKHAGEIATVPHRPRLVTDDMGVLREAALAGIGIVQLPTLAIWKDIEAGRLLHVLPDWRPHDGIVHAVFAARRGLLPAVRVLLDHLGRECAAERVAVSDAFRRHDHPDGA